MKIGPITRFQIILVYVLSQITFPVMALIMLGLLAIYIANILFKQPEPLVYFWDISIELIVVAVLALFCIYVSFINAILNAIKFGKTKIAGNIIDNTNLVPLETKLFYNNIIGNKDKALEIANILCKDQKKSRFDKKYTTKLFIIDAFLNSKKYKKAQAVIFSDITPIESDIVTAKNALLTLYRDKDEQKAIKLALEAININENMAVRNSDPKLFELKLILVEIYYATEKYKEAYETLIPWIETISKYPLYSCCKYNKFNMAQCYLLVAKILSKQKADRDEIEIYLNKSIKTFKNSSYAKEARLILAR